MSELRDWATGLAKPKKPEERFSFMDSALELAQGAEVHELDTVPAELIDLVPPATPER